MAMKLLVTYENAKTGEYEKYTTTFEELADSFNGMLNEEIVGKALRDTGKAILANGYATTTVKAIGAALECRCCGRTVPPMDSYPIHTACIPKHWNKHANGVNASRCREFGREAKTV